uniref:Coatomer subunit alpha n=1 Tax=Sphaerodactylus townsendi TaxID=933632 RepID=A0ACB8F321_9SAUR
MSGSRPPPPHHPATGPGATGPPGASSSSAAAASSVTTSASSATAAAPGSSSSAGLGVPARPVLVAAAVSGSSSGGLSRLAGTGRAGPGSGASGGSGGSSRKRPLLTPLCNGLLNSYEDKSNDFVCPICFEMIEEAYMTKCGHSFCYKCIHQSLEDNNRCPKCNYVVDNIDHLYPNFLVNELILKQKQRFEEKRFKLDHSNGHRWQIFQDLLGTDQDNLDLANVNLMLELLVQKKKQLEAESHAAQLQILMEFLKVARRNKREGNITKRPHAVEQEEERLNILMTAGRAKVKMMKSNQLSYPPDGGRQLEQIQKELSVLEEDIKRVEVRYPAIEHCLVSIKLSALL